MIQEFYGMAQITGFYFIKKRIIKEINEKLIETDFAITDLSHQ